MWRVSLLTQSAIRNSHHVTDTNRKMQDAVISTYVTISQNNIIFQTGIAEKNLLKSSFYGFPRLWTSVLSHWGFHLKNSNFCFRKKLA
jgi:hypothetical protein